MEAMIVITTTATRRPEILRKTLESFYYHLFGDLQDTQAGLILNIDPVGPGLAEDVIRIARRYFSVIAIRHPMRPSFSEAFKWTWDMARRHKEASYVFNLEDDWKLLYPVDIKNMIEILESEPELALLRLPAFPAGADNMKNWNLFFPWNGRFYECPENLKITAGFCGHPSLIKMDFVRAVAPLLDGKRNPEKQFHRGGPPELLKEVARWRYGVYARPGDPPAISDIGRKWMTRNNLSKAGSKAYFTHWEEVDA